jgi:abortive infection bacteriophage resistance protein
MRNRTSTFTKPSLSYEQQLELLLQRGLQITNPEQALFYLKFIGYYRLSGYARY